MQVSDIMALVERRYEWRLSVLLLVSLEAVSVAPLTVSVTDLAALLRNS